MSSDQIRASPPTPTEPTSSERLVPTALVLAGGLAGLLGAALLASSQLGLAVAEPASQWVRVVGSVFLLLASGLVAGGLGVVVFRPVLKGSADAARGAGSHRVILTTVAFAVLVAFVVSNVLPLVVLRLTGQRSIQSVPGFLTAAVSVGSVLLLVAYFRFIRPGVVTVEDFGFGRNRFARGGSVWLAHLLTGAVGWVAILAASAIVQAVLRSLGIQQTQLRDYTWVQSLPLAGFLAVLLAGVVLAPLAEEIFFRGVVFRLYHETQGPLVAYGVSAVLFGVLHLNPPAFLPIAILGLLLATLYRVTGSLVPGIVAHGLNNGLAFIVLYSGVVPVGGG